jgi:hypothetical protein
MAAGVLLAALLVAGGALLAPASARAEASAALILSLPDLPDVADYLPSVDAVSVTLAADGRCTAKTIRPTAVSIEARLAGVARGIAPPASVEFLLTASAYPGTAVNEDCELNARPDPDFSVGVPEAGALRAVVPETTPGSGRYRTTLYAWDWGGSVTVTVTSALASGTLALPIDTDGDGLPDRYERNAVPGVDNRDVSGRNVLDAGNADQDGNGVRDGGDRFARDGLSNLEKFRGIYVVSPAPRHSGEMRGHVRLGTCSSARAASAATPRSATTPARAASIRRRPTPRDGRSCGRRRRSPWSRVRRSRSPRRSATPASTSTTSPPPSRRRPSFRRGR